MTDAIERIIRIVVAEEGKDTTIEQIYQACSERIQVEFEQWANARGELSALEDMTFDEWWSRQRDRSLEERALAGRAWHAGQRETERQVLRCAECRCAIQGPLMCQECG